MVVFRMRRTALRQWQAVCLCFLAFVGCARDPDAGASKPKLVSYDLPSENPVREIGATQALAAAGRLWLVGRGGGLASFGLEGDFRNGTFASDVLFAAKSGGTLWVLRSTEVRYREVEDPPTRIPIGGTFVVSKWAGGAFEDSAPLRLSEMPTALAISQDGSRLVVSPSRISNLPGGSRRWTSRKLKGPAEPLHPPSTPAIAMIGDDLYLGFNFGEFGGGLRKVSLSTGVARNIVYKYGQTPCQGCEPITGIIADPASPDCILISAGLIHMMSWGRISQICGDRATVKFEKTFTVDWGRKSIEMTVPFFGIAAAPPGGFWAIAPGTLYRFEGQDPKEYPLSEPKTADGLVINRDLPGVIIVYTNANQAFSLSGTTPMLVPLD
ncbi:hypothetical protein [Inquilinus sp. Marseille-Q2685]|uniref:hypothetical protein n=1 Tax=Inquilinus sp. Marseille-Q2685 TaxID=2866581 RepID=UPI001CE40AC2|nr:hypothetical protein [Inquilinus sp. Marseille-Q2685]